MSRALTGVVLSLVLLVATTEAAIGQDWRTISQRRQGAGENLLKVDVSFGAGRLRVLPAESGTLYRSSIRYDAQSVQPISEYESGRLRLGVTGTNGRPTKSIRDGGRLDIALGPDVPTELELKFGAVEAEIDLGGLRITEAKISTGASDSRVRFSHPNPERMRNLAIEAGAAAFRAEGLGNANVESISVEGGVGDITLDFTGRWRGDTRATVEIGLGAVELRVPRGVGVRVSKDTFLMGFDAQDLVKRGDTYYSTNWDGAEHRLTVDIDGAFGSIKIRWVDPNDTL